MVEPIHKSEVVVGIIDRSAANFEEDWGTPIGQLPRMNVTMWGQVKFKKELVRTNREQGDLPEADGHVWFRKPLTNALERGDRVVSVDGTALDAEIIEIQDGVRYSRPRAVKALFKIDRDD